MNFVEIKKELEGYGNLREKVLRLNEIDKFNLIMCGSEYIKYYDKYDYEPTSGNYGCCFCYGGSYNYYKVQLKIKNCNVVCYFTCHECKDKTLCAYCLREKQNCIFLTKQKIAFWLSSQKTFPKDIRRLITNLFFKN